MENNPLHAVTEPIVNGWRNLFRQAKAAKRDFDNRGAQIEQFYASVSGFMWTPGYMNQFMGGGVTPPKFRLEINKAFEYVALMGPMLYWQSAARKCKAYKAMKPDPEGLLAIISAKYNDPYEDPEILQQQAMQEADELLQQQARDDARNVRRAAIIEHCLNYFQREQPGELAGHSSIAVTEGLLRGCGFLRTEPYRHKGSNRTLVRSVRVPVDDVFVDPDSKDPLWLDSKWIIIRHRDPCYKVERRFGLRRGSMDRYAGTQDSPATTVPGQPLVAQTSSKKMLEWYEVFSRAGVGSKITDDGIAPEFDDLCDGDAAYLAFTMTCPYPLNLPSAALDSEYEEDGEIGSPGWVKEQLRWPTEYWLDTKWPISKLMFYPHSTSDLWPQPPLAAAVGEMTALNILISAYVQAAYDNRQQIGVYMKGMVDDIDKVMRSSESPVWIAVEPQLKQTVGQLVEFMNRPEVNQDVPKTIEFLMHLIEQRTGLSDMLYGMPSGANPRSAAEYEGRMSSVNLRPEHMQKCVAAWQSDVADKEVFCMWSHVGAQDLAEQLGPAGMYEYDDLVTNDNPEAILRGSQAYVEASDIARPNKARDADMLKQMSQYLVPVLSGYSATYQDPKPLNGFIQAMGDATDTDVTPFLIPDRPVDEEAARMQKEMQQAQLDKVRSEVEVNMSKANATGAQAESAQNDAMLKQQEAATKAQQAEQQMSLKEQEAQLKAAQAEHAMQIKEQEAQLKLSTQAEMADIKAADGIQQIDIKQKKADQERNQRAAEAIQRMTQQWIDAHQSMSQKAESHRQDIQITDEKAAADARKANIILSSRMMMQGLRNGSR